MLLSSLVLIAPAFHDVDAKIVATSMFKNGFAVVMRQIDVPGPGEYDLRAIPSASFGTLWFAASDGTSLDGVRTITTKSSSQVADTNLDQVLASNVGKDLVLALGSPDPVSGQSVSGTLLSASGDALVIRTADGILAIAKSRVSSITSKRGDLVYETPQESLSHGLGFTVSGRAGHISMVSLERGLTWVPAYAIDISGKKALKLTAKSTVVNDLEDLTSVDARFVTGFPYMQFARLMDPLINGLSLADFQNLMQSPAGLTNNAFATRSGALTNQAAGIGGQLQGGVGLVPEGIEFISFNPTDNRFIVQGSADAIAENARISGRAGPQLEDLFFYQQPNLSLTKGDRAYFVLFRAEAPYKEIYTWDSADPYANGINQSQPQDALPEDVWHTIEFKNTSGHPLTTGPATTFQDGQILGQDTLKYASAGGDAELRITKALDIRAESSEEEVGRERASIRNPSNYGILDLVTIKGTLEATNLKKEPATLRIRHDFTGEFVSAEGDPVVKKTARGLRQANPTGRLTWTKTIEPGQKLALTYEYKIYVPSNGG